VEENEQEEGFRREEYSSTTSGQLSAWEQVPSLSKSHIELNYRSKVYLKLLHNSKLIASDGSATPAR
jgi:hypothetical protein